jgi:hypothetical protein
LAPVAANRAPIRKLVSQETTSQEAKAVDNALGILVWTTLIAGSATVLFLALPDILFWCIGVRERMGGAGREGIEERLITPTVTQSPKKSFVKKRRKRRRRF